jgi:hypothetical protein
MHPESGRFQNLRARRVRQIDIPGDSVRSSWRRRLLRRKAKMTSEMASEHAIAVPVVSGRIMVPLGGRTYCRIAAIGCQDWAPDEEAAQAAIGECRNKLVPRNRGTMQARASGGGNHQQDSGTVSGSREVGNQRFVALIKVTQHG